MEVKADELLKESKKGTNQVSGESFQEEEE